MSLQRIIKATAKLLINSWSSSVIDTLLFMFEDSPLWGDADGLPTRRSKHFVGRGATIRPLMQTASMSGVAAAHNSEQLPLRGRG